LLLPHDCVTKRPRHRNKLKKVDEQNCSQVNKKPDSDKHEYIPSSLVVAASPANRLKLHNKQEEVAQQVIEVGLTVHQIIFQFFLSVLALRFLAILLTESL
jgi:hypothetical protein